ncbi:TetR family transcriptional regulator [Halieaceae bacterium IMCC14734]|uniref:TetR family transcriptional regulator n=1 Tax=Candidatus Litorirhabdus singularis TaxID=2518993 RepID=A0ABT3TES1_9GAMM|nr:TetR family transcriptional regulator [Candidatus Litorirhabdus singularis]MCX2980796.1 TetR family transcriptional regulator [Candidatus Litorirhabdus singularis]
MRRTKEDAAKTRQSLVDAALKLFGQRGYSGTTLRLIAEEAGCSRGPIYWHFANKEELFEEILAYSQVPLEQLVDRYQGSSDPETAADEFSRRWLLLLVDDSYFRQSFEIFLNKTEFTEAVSSTLARERALTASLIATFSGWVASYRQHATTVPATSCDTVALSMYAYLMGITYSWLFDSRITDLDNNLDFFVGEFLRLMLTVD